MKIRDHQNFPQPRFSAIKACAFVGLAFCLVFPVAASGKTRLIRQFRPGQQLVYQTAVKTEVSVSSNPEGLKALLPPMPKVITARQQNTITVRSIDASGVAEVENRFDRFEFDTQLDESIPEDIRKAAESAQEEFAHQLNGQTLTARYDRAGRLLGFGGAEAALSELDPPMQEAAKQTLRVFLEQMGGGALYPDHPLKEGEEWKLSLNSPPTEAFPYTMEGENTLRFVGKTRVGKIKAAIVEIRFTNLLKPSAESVQRDAAWAHLQAQGMGLEISVRGEGQGRLLVALDDGRVLQNQSTIHQTLKAEMPNAAGIKIPVNGPLSLQIDSETTIRVDESGVPHP
jgi:hypothetical protein